jgi:dipeptidyl aminopeptidase/acylaminoacyl peptidase
MKYLLLSAALSGIIILQSCNQNSTTTKTGKMEKDTSTGYLTFKLSNQVTMERVKYKNRYGISIAADVYKPKIMDRTEKYPALVPRRFDPF